MEVKNDILSLADDYETFFIDVYGVIFDGTSFHERALSVLERLKKNKKKIIILSNSTQISDEAKIRYAYSGMMQNVHYDEFVTSGEFLHHIIMNHPWEFSESIGGKSETVKCIFTGNGDIFEDTHIKMGDLQSADFLYVGIPRASYGAVQIDDVWDCNGNKINIEDVLEKDWNSLQDSQGRKGFAEFAHLLNNCLRWNKTLLVANPDIFALSFGRDSRMQISIITQGAIAAYYEKLGGKVAYFGKPYRGIFEYAKQIVDSKGAILMVGDTPWTDISGANASGLDSALVMTTGVSHEFMKQMDDSLSLQEKCQILFEKITPKMTKLPFNVWPKHYINCFSSSGW
ncbi:MAG: HAD hydrolase-like protein [Holosporaceae bacterium]|jgi:ribonucleotide monophosphatase NagD (HAD superfamily)|nr:HAD hydrolase-like protein [Holosporaceae bacterium]